MLNPADLAEILRAHPYPGVTDLVIEDGDLNLTFEGATVPLDGELWRLDGVGVRFDVDGWNTCGLTVRSHLSAAPTPDAVHAEIALVLRLAAKTPESPARRDRRLTDEMGRRRDAEQALAKMTDAHAVVSQRLAGSQKEVATLTAQHDDWQADIDRAHRERDEATARADKATAQAKEMRVSFAEFERRGEQIARDDELREQIAVAVGLDRSASLEQIARDDDLRSQLAVAVGLDGSASLALILDTVTRDRPAREISRLSGLLDVLAAPVTFGERHLSTVERAEWALRRALRERDECAPRMAQLIDAEVLLDTLGVPAYATVPGDDPGDASEALTVAERLRFYFGAQS